MEERFDLGDARVDPDHLGRALGQQVVTEPAAAIHLDQETAQVAQQILTRLQERATLTPEQASVRAPRSDTLVRSAPAKEWGHPGESNEGEYGLLLLQLHDDQALFRHLPHRPGGAFLRVPGGLHAAVGHLVGAEGREPR